MKKNTTIRMARPSIKRLGLALVAAGAVLATGGASAAPLTWGGGNGTWDTVNANWLDAGLAPAFFVDGDDVDFAATGDITISVVGSVSPLSTTVSAASGNYTINGPGTIDGAGSLTKSGAGQLTMNTPNNTFTGKTSIQGGTLLTGGAAYLSNAGSPGVFGAPLAGPDATIDLHNGVTLRSNGSNPRVNQSTDRLLNLAGDGPGTVSIRYNDNDASLTFGGVIATGTGEKLLKIDTGINGNGDREAIIFTGEIADSSLDSSATSLEVTFNTQGSPNWVSLNGVNTFTGPITLAQINGTAKGVLVVGGVRAAINGANTVGTGSLGSGNYPGDITLGVRTVLEYDSTATQTLAGAISGPGALQLTGSGTVTLSGASTFTGGTTVNGGCSLVLADDGGMTFTVTDSSTNKITGGGSAEFGGDFTIDTSAVTVSSGEWTLVDVAAPSFTSSFTVAGLGWSEASDVWRLEDGPKVWTFTEGDGKLRVTSPALFTSFGIPGYPAVIDNNLLTVKLTVPKGTVLASVAPEFTLTSGAADQTSGAVPSPDFGSSNPVTYTVTDGATVNPYTVLVIESTGIINMSIENPAQPSNPLLLEGPAGGLDETWNQITTSSAGSLRDSVGFVTTAGFTQTGNLDGIDIWGTPTLQMIWSGLRVFPTGATFQVSINGLTEGDVYDVYVASANVNAGQRSKGDWTTPNTTATAGIQSVDNTTVLNTTTWQRGNNYVLFENVVVDATGKILLNGDAADTYRLPLNGFQLVPAGMGGGDFDDWLGGFTFEPGDDTTATGDPDGDGNSNFDEYAFGLDPTSGSSVNPVTVPLDPGTGLFRYTRRDTALTDLEYTYEWSTTLEGVWSDFTPVSEDLIGTVNSVETIEVEVPGLLLAEPLLFVRVRALPPGS